MGSASEKRAFSPKEDQPWHPRKRGVSSLTWTFVTSGQWALFFYCPPPSTLCVSCSLSEMGDNDNHSFCPSRWWEELRGPERKSSRNDSYCFPANPFFLSLPPLEQPPPPWHSGVGPRGAVEGGTTVETRARCGWGASARLQLLPALLKLPLPHS